MSQEARKVDVSLESKESREGNLKILQKKKRHKRMDLDVSCDHGLLIIDRKVGNI